MDIIEGIKERRSVRKYTQDKISHDILKEIVDVAAYAPSWKNTQIVRYIIVEDKDKIEALTDPKVVLGFDFNGKTIGRAAAVALVTFVKGVSGYEKDGSFSTPKEDKWETFDAGIATQTFCLAAHAKGIGTTILGIFDEEEVKKIINIPENQELAAMVTMGYPEKMPACPPRMTSEELLTIY